MKLEDLKAGQMISLRWEYWNHDIESFEPRTLHLVLLGRSDSYGPKRRRTEGWRVKVTYDSKPRPKNRSAEVIPYDNVYFDSWLRASINEGKLVILSDIK